VNFLKTQALLVRPDQEQTTLELPQVAPGRYEALVTASAEGPYFLNIVQQAAAGQAELGRPAGFVVPYSPEYRTLRSNSDILLQLARATSGRQLLDPSQAFDRAVPAGGSPREIWPWLAAVAAFLFLLDVAVRRLRLALLDLRRAAVDRGYELLGRAQVVVAPAQARLLAAKNRIAVDTPLLSGRPGSQLTGTTNRIEGDADQTASQPSSSAVLSSRLLEAKKRANQKED
jgi:hypothetical protein